MIETKCGGCGGKLEFPEKLAGQSVECPRCGQQVKVRPSFWAPGRDGGLSRGEYLLFTLLFLSWPAVNVWVSSILYYVWRKSRPRRARQINTLGFLVFGVQVVAIVVFFIFFFTTVHPPQ
jgi:uncharacterized paraquat-inducible protein A